MEERLENWKKEIGEIPEHTCPDINKLIEEHGNILKELSYLEKNASRYDTGEDLVKDFPSYWFSNVESIAEQLRNDNQQLRELGIFWYEKTQEVLTELENLKEWNKVHGFEPTPTVERG